MSGAEEIDIDEENLAPAPKGAPADFRERLVLALKTTDPATLAAAERDFRGCYDSPDEYVREALAQHVPAWLAWVLEFAPADKLRHAHESAGGTVWTIALESGVLVFESPREQARRFSRR